MFVSGEIGDEVIEVPEEGDRRQKSGVRMASVLRSSLDEKQIPHPCGDSG
jgi:hypothetical protein